MLGWTRKEGQGHFRIEEERKDIICYDDSNPPFPVIIFETKKPSETITLESKDQLEGYLKEVGSAKHGVLTNGRKMLLYEYVSASNPLKKIAEIDIDDLLIKKIQGLSEKDKISIQAFMYLSHDRFVKLSDIDIFSTKNKESPIHYGRGLKDIGYSLFVSSLKSSLDELTETLELFFDDYIIRTTYSGDFLKTSFQKWEEWRAFTGASGKAKQAFCRETAYIILNRIIFTRICEDKRIIKSQKISGKGLVQFIKSKEGMKNIYVLALNDAYREIENHYKHFYQVNIFDWWFIPKDKTEMLTPQEKLNQVKLDSELDFIVKGILKRVNRFDFERVNRDILGHVYEDYLPKQERKELGEFYTPIEVVKYILDSVGYLPEKPIGDKKIIDPSCGSGTFLTEIVERIIKHYLKKFNKINTNQLTSDEAKLILDKINENVYGLDLNPFATHISEINLLFKTIDLYNVVLRKYRDEIMSKFNIHCVDTLQIPDGINIINNGQLTFEFFAKINGRAKSFSDDILAADKIKTTIKFDFVVGNPPYVRIQNLKKAKELYENEYYETRHQNYDIYVLFIERGLKWLNESGKLGFICPTRFILADYGEKLRYFVAKKYLIEQVIDFKETGVFDAAAPYPCILIISSSNKEAIKNNSIICSRIAKESNNVLIDIQKHLKEDVYISDVYDLFRYPQKDLAKDEWYLMPEREKNVFRKIEKNSDYRLKEICSDLFVGMQTSADDIYLGSIENVIDSDIIEFTSLKYAKDNSFNKFKIEKKILKKILKGKCIGKWEVDWDNLWAIHPYEIINGKPILINETKFKNNYPLAWQYLYVHKDILEGRENNKLKGKEGWYKHLYEKNLDKFENPKILVRNLSQKNEFTLDEIGEYYLTCGAGGISGLNIDASRLDSSDKLYFYVALLNSRILEYYHKHISSIYQGKWYSYEKTNLDLYPIADTNDLKLRNEIINLAKKSQEVHNIVYKLNKKIANIENYLIGINLCSKLLDISINQDISSEVYKSRNAKIDSITNLEGLRTYQFIFKKGHSITFDSKEKAEFLMKILQGKEHISKAELLFMNVPNQNDIMKLMSDYYQDKIEIEKLNLEIGTTQSNLDEIIATKVYRLNKNDIAVMDKFLQVW